MIKFRGALMICTIVSATLMFSGNAYSGCSIAVNITNTNASTNAHISRLGVKSKGGTWRNIQENGKRILNNNDTYKEIFKPTIQSGCDGKRRYRFKVKCMSTSMAGLPVKEKQTWIYYPSENGWTRTRRINMETTCP